MTTDSDANLIITINGKHIKQVYELVYLWSQIVSNQLWFGSCKILALTRLGSFGEKQEIAYIKKGRQKISPRKLRLQKPFNEIHGEQTTH